MSQSRKGKSTNFESQTALITLFRGTYITACITARVMHIVELRCVSCLSRRFFRCSLLKLTRGLTGAPGLEPEAKARADTSDEGREKPVDNGMDNAPSAGINAKGQSRDNITSRHLQQSLRRTAFQVNHARCIRIVQSVPSIAEKSLI